MDDLDLLTDESGDLLLTEDGDTIIVDGSTVYYNDITDVNFEEL